MWRPGHGDKVLWQMGVPQMYAGAPKGAPGRLQGGEMGRWGRKFRLPNFTCSWGERLKNAKMLLNSYINA